MACPKGRLTRLSASSGDDIAHLPIDRLAELELSESCSGISTLAVPETEGSTNVIAIELRIELSREYIREELLVFFDPKSFKFTNARHLVSRGGEPMQATRVTF